jgi:hypothetical protein
LSSRSIITLATLIAFGWGAEAGARPEKIRAGNSYYSNSELATGLIRDIDGEKNYEEVYQSYRYYEAVYDENARVVRFVEYVRGAATRTETYRYGLDGRLVERVIERPGQPSEVTIPDATSDEAPADPEAQLRSSRTSRRSLSRRER